jgi:acyl-CoA hydrolase
MRPSKSGVSSDVGLGEIAHVRAGDVLRPVFVGDEVSVYARLIAAGRTSMRIEVKASRRARASSIYPRDQGRLHLRLDTRGRPCPIAAD